MKKLITLLLFMGCVCTASAWDNVYLNDDDNNWGGGSSQFFSGSNNDFYYDLNSTKLTRVRNGNYYFRFFVSNEGGHFRPQTNNDLITDTDYSNCVSGEDDISFKIYDTNAKSVRINLSYNNSTDNTWKWHVTATIETYANTTSVYYVNENGKTDLGSDVYAYVWDPSTGNLVITGTGWPGTKMTYSDGVFSLTGINYTSDMNVIFNNGKDPSETGAKQTGNLTFTENNFYNYVGVVENVTVSLPNNPYGTFSSDYPLTFPDGDVNIKAYTASMSNGRVLMTRVTGVVPAKTGLFLVRKDDTNNSISAVPNATATVDVSDNLLHATTGSAITSNNLFSFVKRTNGANVDYGFVKVASGYSWAVGLAYLETTAGARELSFSFDEEGTTDINDELKVNNEKLSGDVFNLAGQRVAQPSKGLYIVNGKKVMMK